MPALPVIVGAASMASGAAAFSAAAGFTLANVAAGAMVVGGAMTAVGGLTGNQSMQKTGGMLSLAGGIGGLATGTLGDPTKVFSGGGTVNTGGSWFGGTDSATKAALDNAGAVSSASNTASSAMNMNYDSIIGKAPTSAGSDFMNLANSSKTMSGATNVLNTASNAASSSTGILDKLAKYDTLVKVGGGIADYYQNEQKQIQDQQQFDQAVALKQQQIALNQQQMNSGAGVTVPIQAVPNQSGLINTGMTPTPIPVNGTTAVPVRAA